MMKTSRMKTILAVLAMLVALTYWACTPVLAASTDTAPATVTLSGGGLNVSLTSGTISFPATTLSGNDQTITAGGAGPVFRLQDASGKGDGWHLTFQSSDFKDNNGGGTVTIPVANFTFNPTGGAIAVNGTGSQPVDNTNGPREPGGGAQSLGSAVTVVTSAATYGKGKYDYTPLVGNFSLTIPGTQLLGDGNFKATVTVTIVSGP